MNQKQIQQEIDRNITARFLGNASERISRFVLLFCGVVILILAVSVSYGVIRRYVFNSPEPFSYEVNVIMFLASVIFSLPAVQWLSRHIRVDFMVKAFPKGVQTVLAKIFEPALALVYIGILIWWGFGGAIYSMQIGETSQSVWREQIFPIKLMVPIGFSLLGFVVIAQVWRGIVSLRKGHLK